MSPRGRVRALGPHVKADQEQAHVIGLAGAASELDHGIQDVALQLLGWRAGVPRHDFLQPRAEFFVRGSRGWGQAPPLFILVTTLWELSVRHQRSSRPPVLKIIGEVGPQTAAALGVQL